MSDLLPIRFDANGPAGAGMKEWEKISAEGLTAGDPVQHGHEYFKDDTGQLTAGVWDGTPMTTRLEPYSVSEFMLLLEGEVTIVDARGNEQTMRAGDTFVIPKGMPCVWMQTGYVRKFYVIFDDRSGKVAADPDKLAVIRPRGDGPLSLVTSQDTSRYLNGTPTQHSHEWFTDASEQMHVGVWDTTDMHTRPLLFARNELMHLLAGEVSLTNGDGVVSTFRAGDTFMVPRGMSYRWDSSGYVKKFYCIFQPAG